MPTTADLAALTRLIEWMTTHQLPTPLAILPCPPSTPEVSVSTLADLLAYAEADQATTIAVSTGPEGTCHRVTTLLASVYHDDQDTTAPRRDSRTITLAELRDTAPHA